MIGDLERQAAEAERLASEAAALVDAETAACETPLMRAKRTAREAAEKRQAADLARRTWTRRVAFLAFRLAVLAALLWGAWRIGYESGLVAALARACT